ncbi:DUF1253-domain-containing protein [Xylona heveae TC161]|uniref:U3 small nucleolar RNA-associated protein 25 n=1 Tax=Xylona heveae (strain CBS 132557 / TC161) TaxID=1328760 RepID=A0A165IYR3_XYLHT|nr:DUF1253-domain-containing protein [Xylona heveae TC161]KZF25562.1 DUF1253-domain-containing protein [Xylona heveae TC161]
MGPRGGRGRGRGGGRGRGRGAPRGRGRGRGGRQLTFHTSRVEEKLESDSEGPEEYEEEPSESEEEQEELLSEDSSDDEEADKNAIRPYNALIQSLNANKPKKPENKKRKAEETDGLTAEPAESKKAKPDEEPSDDEEADVDQVDEPEEAGDEASIAEEAAEIDDEDDASDSYEVHFTNWQEKDVAAKIKSISENKWKTEKGYYNNVGRSVLYSPSTDGPSTASRSRISSTKDLKIKKRLQHTAQEAFPGFGALEQALASHIFNYQDIFFCARSVENAETLRKLSCLHALDLIFKTRDRVIKNNARLAKVSDSEELELRDQGFTRPKVLMILPTRQSCVRFVETIVQLCSPEQQENRKRFQDSYVQSEDTFSADRPADFRELFEGNDDDMFRLGLKFTRKTIKYFSQFYNSDIIFASPLGLRMAIGAEGSKKQDFDFLSSIELAIIDQADGLLMQNWEHVEHVLAHMNLQPKEAHGCDFSRVRNFYLDGHAKHFRQTILCSPFNTPELNSIFNHNMLNIGGKLKITRDYDAPGTTTLDLNGLSIKQTFSRFDSKSPATDPDARFEYFSTAIVPSIARQARLASSSSSTSRREGAQGGSGGGLGMLVFIPSYLDFVRVRNFFATSPTTSHISFGSISEYTPVRDVARARSHFLSGRHSVLLYSERAHHFRRFHLRGVNKVVFYAPPDNPLFYREVAGAYIGASVAEGRVDTAEASVRVAFSKWDTLRLERIVGTKRVASMVREKGGDTFDFV